MVTLEVVLAEKGIPGEPLSKGAAIQLNKAWLAKFANKMKQTTGKWKVGDHLWEAFASRVQPAVSNVRAITIYKQQPVEPFYVFDESGKQCLYCKANEYPKFYNSGLDIYIVPVSQAWTMAFCQDNVTYFAKYSE